MDTLKFLNSSAEITSTGEASSSLDFKYEATIGLFTTNPQDMPKDHSELPVWNSENWFYEDVIIDHKIRSLRRTISEGEAMQFNMMVLDIHPYVADDHFATNEGIFNKTE